MTASLQGGEEPLDLAEPAYDAPPAFRDADERRIHVRAYNQWAVLLRGRAFPAVSDIDPASADFGPNAVLLDLGGDGETKALRFVGRRLREEAGLRTADAAPTDIPPGSLLARLTDRCAAVLEKRAPVGFEAEFISARQLRTLYRGILMPLSTDGRSIDAIYGVINWKEVADVDLTAGLVAEMMEALAMSVPSATRGADPFETPTTG